MTTLLSRVTGLLSHAERAAVTADAAALLAAARVRAEEPLRVALVGRVKAGKSTLLNALVGEQLAATDAGECTRVVTWYRYGPSLRAVVHGRDGRSRNCTVQPGPAGVRMDLEGPADEIERVDVWLPSRRLRSCTIIDTPGLDALHSSASRRTVELLGIDHGRVTQADAVLYLLRHAHRSDTRFLEAFHGDELVQGTPLNTLGVLSRADEVGLSRLDALDIAARVAERYRDDDRMRRLCPLVVPVAGLLACFGEALQEDEFRALAEVAAAPRPVVVGLLLSADDWLTGDPALSASAPLRSRLLNRLGLYGLRLCASLLRSAVVTDRDGLARELVARSGLPRLRAALVDQFLRRADTLKARSALLTLDEVLRGGGCLDGERLAAQVEAVRAGAHEFEELRLLHLLRAGVVPGGPQRLAELDRLLGGAGDSPACRLDMPTGAGPADLRAAAAAALSRCRAVTEHPLAEPELRRVAVGAARSCEGMLAAASPRAAAVSAPP